MRNFYNIFQILLFIFALREVHADEIVLAVHPSVAMQAVTRNFARAMFGMRIPQWPNGGETKIFVLPDDNSLHEEFCKQILNIFPYQLRTAWDRQVFSGTGQAPLEAGSEEQMLQRIATTPGAIGYITKGKADAKKVKLLTIKD